MDIKRYLPHAAAIVIFALITVFFFSPIFFEGKQVRQGDITHAQGISKEIVDYRVKTGEEPLWTNSLFSGMPAYQISVLYPMNLVEYIQKFFMKLMPMPVTPVLLCMVGFYFLLITFKVDPWLSIAGAIAFGLSSYEITFIQAGHNSKGLAIAYMAPVLMGMIITLRGRLWLGAALTAIALALEINANHLQITYYLLITVVIIGLGEIIRLVKEGKMDYLLKAGGLLLVAVILAVLPNLSSLYLTNDYAKESIRGKSDITLGKKDGKKDEGLPIDYATQWSYGKGETFTLLIPDFYGGASEQISKYNEKALDDVDPQFKEYIGGQSAYFGDVAFTSGPVYVGAIICFLFVLGLFIVKDQIKWWILGATVLAILLAWGRNFMGFTEFFFDYIPGYNKFRAVSTTLVVVDLTMPLLAMLAVREIVRNPAEVKAQLKKFYIAFALTGGIALLVYLTPSTFVTPVSDTESAQIIAGAQKQGVTQQVAEQVVANLETARLAIVSSDAIRSFLFILLAGGLLFVYIRSPFNVVMLAGGLALLLLVDMWGVSSRYMSDKKGDYEPKHKIGSDFTKSTADEMILADPDPDYRVLNLATSTWQDASTSYWHKSIGGYHGAKLKRMQELYEHAMDEDISAVTSTLQAQAPDSVRMQTLSKQATLNMLNTKYIIYNPEGGVLVNPYACGNAWFVKEVKVVPDADQSLLAMKDFSPKRTAVVEKSFEDVLGGTPHYDSTATIKLVSYAPNKLEYESNASAEQLAVFSEVYYNKGWDVFIDGAPAKYGRADFTLRAMKVPAGKHKIEFKFEPSFYYTGEKVALVSSLLLFLFVGGAIYLDIKKKNENQQKAA